MGFGARCYETTTFAVQLLGHDLSCFPFIAYWTTLGTLDISYLWSFRVQHVAMFLFLFGLNADTFSRFCGVVSGMREALLLRSCVVFSHIRSGGGGLSAASGIGWIRGLRL
jgi:hypothetical protein